MCPDGGRAVRTSPAFADKLSQATVAKHYHPIEDVDWSRPIDLESFHFPEHALSIYGTDAYERLTPIERRLLSLHESVSYFSTGIWLENMLMYGFLYHLYAMDYADPDVRYMLHEVADEANHSVMFHEWIRRVGMGYVPVTRLGHFLGRFGERHMPRINPYLFFIGILTGEEPPDHIARLARQDEALHPTVRRILEIHSIEEGRHIAYAREYLLRNFSTAPRWRRLHARLIAPFVVLSILNEFYVPRWPVAYDKAPGELRFRPETKALIDAARRGRNPQRAAFRRETLGRLVAFLEEIGAIDASARRRWRRFGLVEA
jgi:hypothetical protein